MDGFVSGLAALNGSVISGDVYAWVIVFVLPVNSALNPVLYTFSSLNIIKVCGFIIYNSEPNFDNLPLVHQIQATQQTQHVLDTYKTRVP